MKSGRLPRLIHLTTIRGVPLLVHCSVFALVFFFLGTGMQHLIIAASAVVAYLGVLIVHELGHQYAAMRRHYAVEQIEIYPLHAFVASKLPNIRSMLR